MHVSWVAVKQPRFNIELVFRLKSKLETGNTSAIQKYSLYSSKY